MNANEKLQTPVYELNFPTRIVNVLNRYEIKTIEQLVGLSPQDIMKRRNSSPTQAKTVAETTEAWFDEQGLSKEGYPLFSKDYSNKINGVTIKKATYTNEPYKLTQSDRENLYRQLDEIAAERLVLTKQVKKTVQIDSETNKTLARTRSRLNQAEELIHEALISSATIIDENCITTYRKNHGLTYAGLSKQLNISIRTIKSYEYLANLWVNKSKIMPLRHYYLSRVYTNTLLNSYLQALGFTETTFINYIDQTILPVVDEIDITIASEKDKLALFIEVLDLDHNAYNILMRCGVRTISDLLARKKFDIKCTRNATDKILNHIITQLSNWCISQDITPDNYKLFRSNDDKIVF